MTSDIFPPEPHKIRFRMPYDHPSPEFVAGLRFFENDDIELVDMDFFSLAALARVTPETLLGWHCTRVPTFEQLLHLCEEVFLVRVADFWEKGTDKYDAEIGPLRDAVRRGLTFHEWADSPPGRLLPPALAEEKMAEWSAPYRKMALRILADVKTFGTLSFSTIQGAWVTVSAARRPGRRPGYSYRYTLHLPSCTGMRPVDLGRKMTTGAVLDALTAQLQVSAYDGARASHNEAEREEIPLFVDLGLVKPPGASGAPLTATAVEP